MRLRRQTLLIGLAACVVSLLWTIWLYATDFGTVGDVYDDGTEIPGSSFVGAFSLAALGILTMIGSRFIRKDT